MRKFLTGAIGLLSILAGTAQAGPLLPSQPLPDFIISNVALSASPGMPSQIGKIAVDVVENCHRAASYSAYVQAAIYASKGGPLTTVTGNGIFLAAGGGVSHIEFNLADKHIPMTSYIYLEVDPQNKVHEVVENNNYWALNPGQIPFPPITGYCNVANPNAMRSQ